MSFNLILREPHEVRGHCREYPRIDRESEDENDTVPLRHKSKTFTCVFRRDTKNRRDGLCEAPNPQITRQNRDGR